MANDRAILRVKCMYLVQCSKNVRVIISGIILIKVLLTSPMTVTSNDSQYIHSISEHKATS